LDVYKEVFYSEKGQIKKTAPEMILTPLKYTKQTLQEINKEYERKRNKPHSFYITGKLLGAALSGDTLSRGRLLHFKNDFPGDEEVSYLKE